MNINQKYQFIGELTAAITASIVEKVPDMPEEWDGIELRQYIADTFVDKTCSLSLRDRKRMREYRNTVLVKNL